MLRIDQGSSPGGWGGARGRFRIASPLVTAMGVSFAVLLAGTAPAYAAPSSARVLEQVSPLSKGGSQVGAYSTGTPSPALTGADGSTLLYSLSPTPGHVGVRGLGGYPLVARRTSTGWTSRSAINGPSADSRIDGLRSDSLHLQPNTGRTSVAFDSGLSFSAENPFRTFPNGDPGGRAGYPASGGVNLGRGATVDWLSRPTWAGASPAPGSLEQGGFLTAGASQDLSTVYFQSRATLTSEDQDSGRNPSQTQALYKWHDGQLSAAGVLPDGTTDPGGSISAGYAFDLNGGGTTSYTGGPRGEAAHPVSDDGSSTLFVSPDPRAATGRAPQLYMTRSGGPTLQISNGPTGIVTAGSLFAGGDSGIVSAFASKDRRYVVFASPDPLTPAAAGDASANGRVKVYRYSVEHSALEYLPELTGGSTSSTPPIFGVSANGSRILYRGADGKIRLWADGAGVVAGTLGEAQASGPTIAGLRFSDDSTKLFVMSSTALGGAADHPAGTTQIYRIETTSGAAECVSCGAVRPNPIGDAKFSNWLASSNTGGGAGSQNSPVLMADTHGISADGESVFFDTPMALRVEDKNDVADVYEWRDGEVRLISQGLATSRASWYIDNDASGGNVFIATADNIGSDDDDLYDMYDARVGGGFPPPEAPPIDCAVAATCQGDPRDPPALLVPGSPLVGPVTVGRKDESPKKTPVVRVSVRRKRLSGSRLTVRVRVPVAGTLRISGSGLRRKTRRVKRPATYTVRVQLSAHGRRVLAKRKKLRVTVRARVTPPKGKAVSKTVKLTIKRTKR